MNKNKTQKKIKHKNKTTKRVNIRKKKRFSVNKQKKRFSLVNNKQKNVQKKLFKGGEDPKDNIILKGIVLTKRIILIASVLNNNSTGNDYECIPKGQQSFKYKPLVGDNNQSYAFEYSSGTSNPGENFPNTFLPINYISPSDWLAKTSKLFWSTHEYLLTYMYNYILEKLPKNCRHNAYLHLEYFINRFGCWKEIQISAALGGGIWESDYTEFVELRDFVLNNDIVEIEIEEQKKAEVWNEYNKPRYGKDVLFYDDPSSKYFIFIKRKSQINYYNFLNMKEYNRADILFAETLDSITIPKVNYTLKDLLLYWQTNKSGILQIIQDYPMPYEEINSFFTQKGIKISMDELNFALANPPPPKKNTEKETTTTKEVNRKKYPYYTIDNQYEWKICNPETDENMNSDFNIDMEELKVLQTQALEELKRKEEEKTKNKKTFKANEVDIISVYLNDKKLNPDEIKAIYAGVFLFDFSTPEELQKRLQGRLKIPGTIKVQYVSEEKK
jgi:hypothetical protein